jgi:hypothetical protein
MAAFEFANPGPFTGRFVRSVVKPVTSASVCPCSAGWGRSADQTLSAVHTYTFSPAAASDLKNTSPGMQVPGKAVPVAKGRVRAAEPKSTFFDCRPRSIFVCASPTPAQAHTNASFKRIMENLE